MEKEAAHECRWILEQPNRLVWRNLGESCVVEDLLSVYDKAIKRAKYWMYKIVFRIYKCVNEF